MVGCVAEGGAAGQDLLELRCLVVGETVGMAGEPVMLLAPAGGNRVPLIAQLVQADEDTVRGVIHRFNEICPACLDLRWAGGRPRLLSTDDEDFVIQAATARPAGHRAHWSARGVQRPLQAGHRCPANRHTTSSRKNAELECGTVPRHSGRVRERGPGPHRTHAVVEVLGGNMRHDLDTFEPGGTGLGLHMRHEQPSDTPPLHVVGNEQQVELRWSEDERVEPEDPASMLVGTDGHKDPVGLDVIRTDPVARNRGSVLALIGA